MTVLGVSFAWLVMVAIFIVGLGGVIVLPNLIRKVVSLSIANSAVIMMFIYHGAGAGAGAGAAAGAGTGAGARGGFGGATAPILDGTVSGRVLADPLPQALMLTAIVVGVCIVALAVALIYRLWMRHGTVDMRELERRIWGDSVGGPEGETNDDGSSDD